MPAARIHRPCNRPGGTGGWRCRSLELRFHPDAAGLLHSNHRRYHVSVVTMRELLEAGVHFGHQTRRWDPKMRRFIFGERGGIYIIDLEQSLQLLEEAAAYARNLGERNGTIL